MKVPIKRAVITKGGKDDTNRPVQQIEYMGKTSEAEIVFPYGVHANLPADSLLVLFPILDTDSSVVAMGGLPNERIQVEEGEVVFFHPLTKAKIHFKENGDIDIDALDLDVNVNCNNLNATVATKATVDAPDAEFTGNVVVKGNLTVEGNSDVTGNLDVAGDTALGASVTSDSIEIGSTHTHTGVTTGSGTSGTPTP